MASSTSATIAGNIKEADAAFHEGFDSHLVGRVQDGRRATTLLQRVTRKAQCREALGVRFHEVQRSEAGEVEPGRWRRHPLRPGQRMCYRNAHIG